MRTIHRQIMKSRKETKGTAKRELWRREYSSKFSLNWTPRKTGLFSPRLACSANCCSKSSLDGRTHLAWVLTFISRPSGMVPGLISKDKVRLPLLTMARASSASTVRPMPVTDKSWALPLQVWPSPRLPVVIWTS